MALNVETVPVGILEVNCHLIWVDDTRKAFVIDPGDDAERIVSRARELSLEPAAVLLTHAHVDHIRGVGGVADELNVPVYLHPDDRALYASPDNALLPWVSAARNLPEPVDAPPEADGLSFEIIHTPGHTPGGVCYHFADSAILFSGDTLFCASIGRTDLAGGDFQSLMRSIKEKLFALPPKTAVHTGHGPPTTIGAEQTSNPFVT